MTVESEIVRVSCSTLDPYTSHAISVLGENSAKAQGLLSAITLVNKLRSSGDRVYLYRLRPEQSFIGFLRVGKRKLFLYDADAKLHEVQPLCCLDFYVSESMQRCGIGCQLFEGMLRQERLSLPSQLAFDNPSAKLLSFLSKNFALDRPIMQANNFVIFLDFFPTPPADFKVAKFLQQCQTIRKSKTHYDSAGVASLFSTKVPLSESGRAASNSSARGMSQCLISRTCDASSTSDKVADALTKAQFYRQEDIEALQLSEESLSQINKKIEERESTIAGIEKELQALQVSSEDLYFGKSGNTAFSKSQLIRQIHR